jgi:hypothetical protein
MDCDRDRDQLLEVLYGEADAETAASFARHVADCCDCRQEMAELTAVRGALQAWQLPRQRPVVRRFAPPRYFWAAAAAALVILAVGGAVGLAGLEMRLQGGPVLVQLGGVGRPAVAPQPATIAPDVLLPAATTTVPARDANEAIVLQRVAELIQQSETRQQQVLRASLSGFEERTARQRRYDLARIGAGLSYLDGKSGQHMARTTELMGYVLQASNRRDP